MMNNREKLDALFREGLDGYRVEPSEGLWKKIESRFFPSSGMRRNISITLIILLLAGTSLVSWWLLSGRSGSSSDTRIEVSTQTPNTKLAEMTSRFDQKKTDENIIPSKSVEYNHEMSRQKNEMTSRIPIQPVPTERTVQKSIQVAMQSASDRNKEIPDRENSEGTATDVFYMGRRTGLIYQPLDLSMEGLSVRELSAGQPIFKTLKDEYARMYELHAGASFMPLVLFYNPNPNNTGWSVSTEITYSRSRLNLYAGLGISRFRDKGAWQINYETYDSVGYYTNITSFRMHPEEPGKIIFETLEVTVFDSVPHVSIEEKSNRYTYIDIPAGIGLNALTSRRFSLTVRAGVKFSILAGKDEPTAYLEMAGATQNEIIREVPTRTPSTWRFTAGIEASYLLTDRLSVRLEPVYEQYLRSVYVNTPDYQAKVPYLIGVNVGARLRIR